MSSGVGFPIGEISFFQFLFPAELIGLEIEVESLPSEEWEDQFQFPGADFFIPEVFFYRVRSGKEIPVRGFTNGGRVSDVQVIVPS